MDLGSTRRNNPALAPGQVALFVEDDELAHTESRLRAASGPDRAPFLVELAWHLRQRDTPRAVALAREAAATALPEAARNRLRLVEGEDLWLHGHLDQALVLGDAAFADFTREGDSVGACDARWLLSSIALDRGSLAAASAGMEQAAALARQGGDTLRELSAEFAAAYWASFDDASAAAVRWGPWLEVLDADSHPGLLAIAEDFRSSLATSAGDYAHGIAARMRAHEASLATGQLRRAITNANNIATAFANLNDHESALAWVERALALAKPTGWCNSIGMCLNQAGSLLRRLGRYEAAQDLLRESLATLAAVPRSGTAATAKLFLGQVELSRGDPATALATFGGLERHAAEIGRHDLQIEAFRGQASALSRLGRPGEALRAAQSELQLARRFNDLSCQVEAMLTLATIHAEHPPDDGPQGASAPSAALDYLLAASEVARTLEGYIIPTDLFATLAREYARCGDFERAYGASLEANAAHARTQSREATERAIAMQVRHQSESAAAEASLQRELALAEERQRIMRDIHDGIGGTLITSLALVRDAKIGGVELAAVLDECISDLELTVDSLGPIDGGLDALLASLRYRAARRLTAAGIETDWQVPELPPLAWIDARHSLSILRILQEALTNVVRHARARHIAIVLRPGTQGGMAGIEIGVTDDGVGFTPESQPGRGRGLGNMRERASILGGRLTFASRAGETRMTLWLPLSPAAASPRPR